MYSSVVLSLFMLLSNQIPEVFILRNWHSMPIWKTAFHSLSPPVPGNEHSLFCFYEFDYSRHLLHMESYRIYLCEPTSLFLNSKDVALLMDIRTVNYFISSLIKGFVLSGHLQAYQNSLFPVFEELMCILLLSNFLQTPWRKDKTAVGIA